MMAASQRSHDRFANTRWSLVAALDNDGGATLAPLLELCLRNWYPVYAYLRRCGHARGDIYRRAEVGHSLASSLCHGITGVQAHPHPQSCAVF